MRAPRSSTATLGREDSHVRSQGSAAGGSNPEAVPEGLLDDGFPRNLGRRLIIAVDFGTTYSAVSYVTLEEGESAQYIDSRRIRSIQNYPDDQNFGYTGDMRCEVPTEVMYPLERRHMREFRRRECMKNAGRTHDSEPEEQNEEYEDSDTVDDEAEPDMPGVDVHMVEEANMDVDMLDDSEGLAIFGPQDDSEGADDNQQSFKWGYSVHEARGLVATHADPTNQVLARFKLLLDNSPLTNAIRARLEPTLRELKAKKIIKDSHHVIVDFLTCLLRHTRSQLKEAGINDEEYHTEMVLCVPAIWTQKACRDMQTALAKAMYLAGFGGVDVENNCIENLFIVSEPEAAAAYVLAKDRRITVRRLLVLHTKSNVMLTDEFTSPVIGLSY